MATLMLEGGADIRFVQQMLGHRKLETTQVYTHVAITKLKEIHAATHPGARLRPSSRSRATAAQEPDEGLTPPEESGGQEGSGVVLGEGLKSQP